MGRIDVLRGCALLTALVVSQAVGGCATDSTGLLKTKYGEETHIAAAGPTAAEQAAISPYQSFEGYFPNVELTTSDGRKVRFFDDLVRGKKVLINFMYTQCDGI